MFMLLGLLNVTLFLLLNFFAPFWEGVIICVGLNMPMLFDGITQRKGVRKSNNVLRSVTGYLSGTGLAIFITSTSYAIVEWIIKFS